MRETHRNQTPKSEISRVTWVIPPNSVNVSGCIDVLRGENTFSRGFFVLRFFYAEPIFIWLYFFLGLEVKKNFFRRTGRGSFRVVIPITNNENRPDTCDGTALNNRTHDRRRRVGRVLQLIKYTDSFLFFFYSSSSSFFFLSTFPGTWQ